MQTLIVFLVAAVIGVKAVSEEGMKKQHEIDVICQKESHLTDEEIIETFKGNYGKNIDNIKVHALCVAKQYGYINDAGDLLPDKIKNYLYEHNEKDAADKILAKCIVKKDTALETAWAFSECIIPIFFPQGKK